MEARALRAFIFSLLVHLGYRESSANLNLVSISNSAAQICENHDTNHKHYLKPLLWIENIFQASLVWKL